MRDHPSDFVASIIRDLLESPAWQDMSPREINSGNCDLFAGELMCHLPKDAILWDGDGHVWVYYLGRHFDAEVPEGVEDWQDLPIYQRYREQFPHYYKES